MLKQVKIPDIGSASGVSVIELLVKVGDFVAKEASLITLETDKATMEIPSPYDGKIESINVKVGDKVSEGDLILTLEMAETETAAANVAEAKAAETKESGTAAKDTAAKDTAVSREDTSTDTKGAARAQPSASVAEDTSKAIGTPSASAPTPATSSQSPAIALTSAPQTPPTLPPLTSSSPSAHAGPAVRRFARELGVDLGKVLGTGRKGRIVASDVKSFVKQVISGGSAGGASAQTGLGLNLPAWPAIDHAKFGEISIEPLSRIKKLSGGFLHRNWVMVPHVTQFDEADITELETFRKESQVLAEQQGVKLTPLVFIMKAVVASLKAFPDFNASLDASCTQLILKKYFHIGVAVDTPNGLVVPVVRDVDQKGLFQLAMELGELSNKARKGQLTALEMQGSSFSISSLGGIGGTAFTPIVNVPDVAILGVSKAQMKPIYQEGEFKPCLMLPLSLSYDHRVIDGAQAARFTTYLVKQLSDIRRMLF